MDHITYHDREFALVVGSANMDVIANTDQPFEMISKKGTIDMSFGGAAHNIAVNLSVMGVPTKFMGSMNEGAVSKLIRTNLRNNNVLMHINFKPDMPDSIFSGQFFQRDLKSSIVSNALDYIDFDEKFIKKGLKDASCVVASCVMRLDVLKKLLSAAKGLPIVLAANTQQQSLKFLELAHYNIQLCLLNSVEMDFLIKNSDKVEKWEDVARLMDTTIIVTEGAKGINIVTAGGIQHIDVTPIEVTGNTLGAGDLIVSAVVYYHIYRKMPLKEALHRAQLKVEQILTQNHVHLGSGDALRMSLQAVTTRSENDPLTGLYNRYGLSNFYADDGLARQRFCALMLDIDHFKKVNDAYGHDVGDKILQHVGKTLAGNIRRGDAACRWGGEEFVVLLVNINLKQAQKIANDLREEIAEHAHTIIDKKHITMSIGVAASHSGEPLEQLVKRADEALYEAKNSGRNRVCVAK